MPSESYKLEVTLLNTLHVDISISLHQKITIVSIT